MSERWTRKFLRSSYTLIVGLSVGVIFTRKYMERNVDENSLAINLMNLNKKHRALISSLQKIQETPQTNETIINHGLNIIQHIRKLEPTISTHHVLRIQSATFINQYYNALNNILNKKFKENELTISEYNVNQTRKYEDMAMAHDLINFNNKEVSQHIVDINKVHMINFARKSRNSKKIFDAYNNIYLNAKKDSNIDDEKNENKNNISDSDLMLLYTHAPYVGDWKTFKKIGDNLLKYHGTLKPKLNDNTNEYTTGHKDGIDFEDIYYLVNKYNLQDSIQNKSFQSLSFNTINIENISIKLVNYKSNNITTSNPSSSNNNSWFPSLFSTQKEINIFERDINEDDIKNNINKEFKLNNDNFNDNIIPLNIQKLGCVQKSISLTKCVKRVSGPILNDGTIVMHGTNTFKIPYKASESNKSINILPDYIPFISSNEFIRIKQTEEWYLKVDSYKNNIFKGKIYVKREPINNELNSSNFNIIELEYDCEMKFSRVN